MKVSQEEEPDLLFILINLAQFKDENGHSMLPNIIKKRELPIQIATLAEAEALQNMGSTTQTTTTTIGVSNGILQFIL